MYESMRIETKQSGHCQTWYLKELLVT